MRDLAKTTEVGLSRFREQLPLECRPAIRLARAMATTPSDDPRTQLAHARANLTPTYVIGVVFVLVAVLFIMASPQDWYGAFKTIHVVFAVIWIGGGS